MVRSFRPALAAALASIFFGGMVFSTRFVVDQTDPLTLAFLRCGIVSLCMAPVLVGRRWSRVPRADLGVIAGLGVVLYAVMPASLGAGLSFTYVSRGAVVLASQPVFTLLLARWRGVERLTPANVLGIAVTAGGLAVSLSGRTPATAGTSVLWLARLLPEGGHVGPLKGSPVGETEKGSTWTWRL